MRSAPHRARAQSGFTLIELAIVLVIITILIGGLAVPLSAQIQARRISETRNTLEEARQALVGYAMTHACTCQYDATGSGSTLQSQTCASCPASNPSSTTTTLTRPYLPCPDTDADGLENRLPTHRCEQARGYLPWVDLGTGAQDAWGGRLAYAVSADLADSTRGISNASVTGGNLLQVLSGVALCSAPNADIAANLAAVVISLGPNSRGARNVNIPFGTATPNPPPETGTNELQNLGTLQSGCTASTFISATPSESFDDLTVWLAVGTLLNRACPTPGGCP
jgi:prepilin-type N-terminal cleavage/methylation domain-containing protein